MEIFNIMVKISIVILMFMNTNYMIKAEKNKDINGIAYHGIWLIITVIIAEGIIHG